MPLDPYCTKVPEDLLQELIAQSSSACMSDDGNTSVEDCSLSEDSSSPSCRDWGSSRLTKQVEVQQLDLHESDRFKLDKYKVRQILSIA
jgi:hypothetical protein